MAPGLEVIYDSEQDGNPPRAAVIDVVAVHGLNLKNNPEHARDTWTKGEELWLRDLPQWLAEPARVMLFEYQSSPISGATLSLEDHAKNLLQWLILKRKGRQNPLVFICHSLGGLVVKEALVEGTLDPSYKSVVEATRLIAFFATPHRGGKYASVGDIAATIIKISLRKPSNNLLNALKQSCEETTRRFEQSRHLFEKCLVISFFEGMPYRGLGIIVEKASATLNLPGTQEKQVAMHSDHSSICKLSSADPASELVLGTVAAEIERALGLHTLNASSSLTDGAQAFAHITAAPRAVHDTIATVSEIIDILSQNIRVVEELRKRWQNVDLTILTFETQLTALRTAWVKINEWNQCNLEAAHYQLTIDLDLCVACCRLLVSRIDAEITQFQTKSGSLYDATGEFQVLLRTEAIRNVQRSMAQQTNTLTLLLAACDRTAPLQQKGILEEPYARETFQNLRDETASLLVHRDVDSLVTRTDNTVTTSKRSLKFDFDKDLFVTRVYERWIRGSVRKVIREQQSDKEELRKLHEAQARQSQAITRSLGKKTRNPWSREREIKVLLLGSESRLDIHKLADIRNGSRMDYKLKIINTLIDGAQALVDQARIFDQFSHEPAKLRDQIKLINAYKLRFRDRSSFDDLDQSFYDALVSVLGSTWIRGLKEQNFNPALPSGAQYFFEEISRIAEKNYVPSNLDILHTTAASVDISEKTITHHKLKCRLIDLGRQQTHIQTWFQYFDAVDWILFVVDLEAYDQYQGEPLQSDLMSLLSWFREVIHRDWRQVPGMLLLLTKVSGFQKKLGSSPLEDYFMCAPAGNNEYTAAEYRVLRRFHEACPSETVLYYNIEDNMESSIFDRLFRLDLDQQINTALRTMPRLYV